MKNTPIRLGIQYFAEGDAGDPANTTPPAAPPQEEQKTTEKTFTQAEVDKIVQERLARAKSPTTTQPTTPAPAVDTAAIDSQLASMRTMLVQSKVESAMAISGIKSEKIERASRLVDFAKCTNDKGEPDKAKIDKEIEALLKDFPELKATAEEGTAGFRIGADNSQTNPNLSSKISEIFGNKKG